MTDYAQFFSYFGLTWGLTAFILLIVAWQAALRGKTPRHRLLMLVLTAGAWIFVVIYLLRYRFPDSLPIVPPGLIPWLAVHGTIALITLFGASLLLWARLSGGPKRGFKDHLNGCHRFYGRIVVVLWLFTHLGGMFNAWAIR